MSSTKRTCTEPFSDKNWDGSCQAMEGHGARFFLTSCKKSSICYVKILGDGNANVYSMLQELTPYPWVDIKKEECVNHIA